MTPLRRQVYISLCSSIWLPPLPLSCLHSLWMVPTEKRHAMYEKAVEMLQEKTPKEIEKFCTRISVPPEVEVICSAILVITEGMKYPESGEPMYVWNHFRAAYIQDDYRKQFFR